MIHEFRDVQFMSAAQKTTVLRAWIRFLKSGLRFDQFTKALYDHLIQHCSFIAHYAEAAIMLSDSSSSYAHPTVCHVHLAPHNPHVARCDMGIMQVCCSRTRNDSDRPADTRVKRLG